MVRDIASGWIRAYLGTGNPAAPFAFESTPVAVDTWWTDKQRVFVVNGWANNPVDPAAPWLGYSAPITGALLAAPLRKDGVFESANLVQSGNWSRGVRFLFAARTD